MCISYNLDKEPLAELSNPLPLALILHFDLAVEVNVLEDHEDPPGLAEHGAVHQTEAEGEKVRARLQHTHTHRGRIIG